MKMWGNGGNGAIKNDQRAPLSNGTCLYFNSKNVQENIIINQQSTIDGRVVSSGDPCT